MLNNKYHQIILLQQRGGAPAHMSAVARGVDAEMMNPNSSSNLKCPGILRSCARKKMDIAETVRLCSCKWQPLLSHNARQLALTICAKIAGRQAPVA